MPKEEKIYEDFDGKGLWGKTYQQIWEEQGLTYQDIQEWISAGFEPSDFTTYLRYKKYHPSLDLNWKQIKKNGIPAQEYLDCFYPKEKRRITRQLNISNKNLTGVLDLSDFVNLEELDCSYSNVIEFRPMNQTTNLIFLESLNSLKVLNLSNDNFNKDLSFLKGKVNLESLEIASSQFYGSLKPLKNLTKLKKLSISNTDIDSGLEYLPDSLETFYCSVKEKKDAKVKAIQNLFANENGEVETDWNGSIRNFPQKLYDYKQWRSLNFSEEEIKQWINTGSTLAEFNFVNNYLKKERNLTPQLVKNKLTELRSEYQWWQKGFTFEQRKEWINAGAKKDDHEFIAYLRDTKKESPQWIITYKEDYQILSERFKKYGLCQECKQPNTGEKWCQVCNSKRLKKDFKKNWYDGVLSNKWTSGNQAIDQFIQKHQLEATDADKLLEWIPYEQFSEIEFLAQGGFGKVYKAKWSEGNTKHWDTENKQWQREKDSKKNYREVALKSLNDSQDNINFLDETAKHKDIDDWFNNIVPCYGLSHDPETGNYLMVMQYMPEGNLRYYLSSKNRELNLKDKIRQLLHIAQGLKDIHAKNLVHRDFHSGNILKGIEKTTCLITDLGLCKPANEINKEEKVFGVLSYVAPEVLQEKPYTQAADVYSFGIVAYELLSGLPPYYDREHSLQLALTICQGQRPKFQIQIPQLLESLIKRCWDANPTKRPTATELEKTLRRWQEEIDKKENTEFKTQLQKAEEYNKNLLDEVKFPDYQKKIHSGAIYTSRLLPTKEITTLLQESSLLDKGKGADDNENKKYNDLKNFVKKILVSFSKETKKELVSELNNKEIESSGNTSILDSIVEKLKTEDLKFEVEKVVKSVKELIKELEKEKTQFQDQETKINYLEQRIQELTNLIKQRKEKIVGIFKRLLPDKEKELNLIQNLVIAHLEYTKVKKQSLPSVPLCRQRDKIRDELEVILGGSLEEEIESSLADCEELVGWELELEKRLKGKTFLIEKQKQTLLKITDDGNNENKKLIELHEKTQQKQQTRLQEAIFQENYLKNQLGKVEELTKQTQEQTPQIIHNPPRNN